MLGNLHKVGSVYAGETTAAYKIYDVLNPNLST